MKKYIFMVLVFCCTTATAQLSTKEPRLTSLYFIYNYILLFLLLLNMKKKSVLILPLLLPIVSMGIVGCSNDDDVNAPQISVIDNLVSFTHSGCKSFSGEKASSRGTLSDLWGPEKFQYEAMAGGRLFVRHLNAIYCCEQDELSVTACLQGQEISIVEREVNARANCVCPFDLDVIIDHLDEGTYTLAIYRYDAETPIAKFEIMYTSDLKGEQLIKQ